MTIDIRPNQIGVRELRDNIRSVLETVKTGQPFMVLSNSEPIAVLLSHDEIYRLENIEFSLAALHGLEIYPELARATSELAALVRGEKPYPKRELEHLHRRRRDILAGVRGGSVSEVRTRMGEILSEVVNEREMRLIVSGGEVVAAFIRIEEYRRLLALRRTMRWFRTAGLDLANADEDQVVAWVREFRAAAHGQAEAEAADEGSAIA